MKKIFFLFFGLAIETWAGLLPMLFLALTLFLFPNGLIGPNGLSVERIKIAFERLKNRVNGLLH